MYYILVLNNASFGGYYHITVPIYQVKVSSCVLEALTLGAIFTTVPLARFNTKWPPLKPLSVGKSQSQLLVRYYAGTKLGAAVARRERLTTACIVHSHVRPPVVNTTRTLFLWFSRISPAMWNIQCCDVNYVNVLDYLCIMTKAKINRSSALYHSAKVSS